MTGAITAPVPTGVTWRAVTGTAAGVLAAGGVARYWGTPAAWWVGAAVAVAVIAASFDLRVRRVPNVLTVFGALVVGAVIVAVSLVLGEELLLPAAIGALIWAAPLFATHVVTRGRSPGLGDVKLAAVLGLAAGGVHPMAAYAGLLASLLGGALFGIGWRMSGRGRSFPFAPAMAAAFVAVLAVWPAVDGATAW